MVGVSQLAPATPMGPIDLASEADLLAACRRNDIRAFERLYQTHGARLKSIAFHIAGNRQDAEDAVHETFVKVYRAIHGFHGQCSIGTWLCRIVINVCYDMGRKRKHEAELPLEDRAGPVSSAGLRITLQDALKRIHPRRRTVFVLFEVEGLRHAEIATVLNVSENQSRVWLFEAKKELKLLLGAMQR
jgi:RNA polymerase sigma-70 factor (ECF subfamily)